MVHRRQGTEFPQVRELAVSSPRLLGEYEKLANAKVPGIVTELTKTPRTAANPARGWLAWARTSGR
ncbi:hypothetical protein F9C11_19185 [Amycolatopsis sp. VS8301801F10]|uniref:hypothetical protein n=1 Tax=Amycolatopsis sp. VS8301801F10 TaxID=2652442 RepID=UPI0038FCED23